MLLKEVGIPVPIPSDLIMITAGVQLAAGAFGPIELAIVAELAILIGCSIHFFLARAAGRRLMYRFGRFVGLTQARLDRITDLLRTRGPFAIILALNVPAARAGVIAPRAWPASAIGDSPPRCSPATASSTAGTLRSVSSPGRRHSRFSRAR